MALLLTKTWLNESSNLNFSKSPDYQNIYTCNRTNRRGAGVAVFLRRGLNGENTLKTSTDKIQLPTIRIKIGKTKIYGTILSK